MASQAPTLDLDALTQRRTVKIGGQLYELRNLNELSIFDYDRLAKNMVKVETVTMNLGKAPDESVAEAKRLLDDSCRLVLIAPDELHASLGAAARYRIVKEGFLTLPGVTLDTLQGAVQTGTTAEALAPEPSTIAESGAETLAETATPTGVTQ